MAWFPYVIRQGEFLTRLASRLGFDAPTVWNDGRNAELRNVRPNHDVLAPGDVLHCPAPTPSQLRVSAHGENLFRAQVPRVDVTLVLQDREGRPLANKPIVVHGCGAAIDTTSCDHGNAAFGWG